MFPVQYEPAVIVVVMDGLKACKLCLSDPCHIMLKII